jgi:hypothetical protein
VAFCGTITSKNKAINSERMEALTLRSPPAETDGF